MSFVSHWNEWHCVSRHIGPLNACLYKIAKGYNSRVTNASGRPMRLTVSVRMSRHRFPVTLRLGASDYNCYKQIWIEDEYAPVIAGLQNPSLIVDLGANVGLSAAYFANAFPRAMIVAVEPEPSNAQLARANVKQYGQQVTVIEAAVWNRLDRVRLNYRPGLETEWAVRTMCVADGEVPTVTIPQLLQRCGKTQIDLLKVDIEGAEQILFGNGCEEWLPCVRNICIELHGSACAAAVNEALVKYRYDKSYSGELTVYRNLRPASL